MAQRGDTSVCEFLKSLLRDVDACVRQAAAQALGQVAQRGDRSTCEFLKVLLRDDDASFRQAGAQALGQVAVLGDAQIERCLRASSRMRMAVSAIQF